MKLNEFLTIVAPVGELIERKSEDYDSGVELEEYFPLGELSYFQMIWTKMLRMKSLVTNPREQNFEGLEDTVDDMIAYLVFLRKYLKDQKDAR